jgi:acyl-CoA thioesterase
MTVATIDTSKVTNEQIGACTKVFGPDNKPFYKVVNSKQETDADGHLIEYSVKAIRRQGKWFFTCDCKAGQNGRQCWHVRASMAAAAEEKSAMAEQVALNEAAAKEEATAEERTKLQICGRPATKEEWDRVMNAKPNIDRKAKAPLTKPFNILK